MAKVDLGSARRQDSRLGLDAVFATSNVSDPGYVCRIGSPCVQVGYTERYIKCFTSFS